MEAHRVQTVGDEGRSWIRTTRGASAEGRTVRAVSQRPPKADPYATRATVAGRPRAFARILRWR